ncbi:phage tail protein, partial [Pseudomonas syringae pv. pisi]
MAYMEQLQSGMKYLVAAGESGRRDLDGMLSPVNGAISEISGATAELEGLPIVGPAIGAKLQRVMRGVNAAQAKVGAVVSTYSRASRAVTQIDERLGVLKEQAAKAGTAINKVAGSISPALANVVPSSSFSPQKTPAVEAVKPFEHLLILQPLSAKAE